MPRKNNRNLQREVNARLAHEAYVSDLKEGRKQRSASFATPKQYKRKGKYGKSWED
jgi:hypothetical protein